VKRTFQKSKGTTTGPPIWTLSDIEGREETATWENIINEKILKPITCRTSRAQGGRGALALIYEEGGN